MIRVTKENGIVYEIGCGIEEDESSSSFQFEFKMICSCKDAPKWIDKKQDAKMMGRQCEMLYWQEGYKHCFGVMPRGAAEYQLMKILETEGYKVEDFIEEDDSPEYDEHGNQIIY